MTWILAFCTLKSKQGKFYLTTNKSSDSIHLIKNLAEMISYAKKSGKVDYIDTTTNAALMSKKRLGPGCGN